MLFFITGHLVSTTASDYRYLPKWRGESGQWVDGEESASHSGINALRIAVTEHASAYESFMKHQGKSTAGPGYDDFERVMKEARKGGLTLAYTFDQGWKSYIHKAGKTYKLDGGKPSREVESWAAPLLTGA